MTNETIVKDDLTNMARRAIEKTMAREGNVLDKETLMSLTVDELRENHRQYRLANGIAGLTLAPQEQPQTTPASEKETWKLVLPALAIKSLGRDCFVTSVKYRDLDKLRVNPEVQRPESKARLPKIAAYVAENNGFFGAAIISVTGAAEGRVMFDEGTLIIEEGAELDVNDGQHRIAGIRKAIADGLIDEERMDDDLPVIVYTDLDVSEQRQMFYDINANAKKPPRAISDNFNERDLLRHFAKELVKSSPVFAGKTNFVKTKIGAKDSDLFTFSNVVDACGVMFDDLSPETFDERLDDAKAFWANVDEHLGKSWEAKSFAITKNAMLAIAKLHGFHVDFAKLGALDWANDGILARVAATGGGTNGAIAALSKRLQAEVVVDEGGE